MSFTYGQRVQTSKSWYGKPKTGIIVTKRKLLEQRGSIRVLLDGQRTATTYAADFWEPISLEAGAEAMVSLHNIECDCEGCTAARLKRE